MKSYLGITFLIFTFSQEVLSNIKEPSLLPGECFAQVFTKKYLNAYGEKKTFQEKNHYIYTCEYTCLDNNKNMHSVLARHEKRVQNEHEMSRSVVCDGVIMKELGDDNLKYYDLSHLERFYSKSSKLTEILKWGEDNNIPNFSLRLDRKMKRIKSKLEDINKSYLLSVKSLDESHGAYQLLKDASKEIEYYLSLSNEKLYLLAKSVKKNKNKGAKIAEGNLKDFYNIYGK